MSVWALYRLPGYVLTSTNNDVAYELKNRSAVGLTHPDCSVGTLLKHFTEIIKL